MQKLVRKYSVPGALPRRGRNALQPLGRPSRASSAHPSPQQLRQTPAVLMPEIPDGVVLDGNVTHLKSPRPTIEKKYKYKE